MGSYLYENWRGKVFVINDRFAEEFKKWLSEDPEVDGSFIDAITPERLINDLPMYEELARIDQLEGMWGQPGTADDRKDRLP
jgi:hypothetical protein